MNNYFLVKVKYDKMMDNGVQKTVTEPYLVDALSFTEAVKQCLPIHDVSYSFYNFAKNYIKIKDGANERFFNDEELKQVEEMQQMMDKGYELKLVHLRKGSKIMWCKKNCT